MISASAVRALIPIFLAIQVDPLRQKERMRIAWKKIVSHVTLIHGLPSNSIRSWPNRNSVYIHEKSIEYMKWKRRKEKKGTAIYQILILKRKPTNQLPLWFKGIQFHRKAISCMFHCRWYKLATIYQNDKFDATWRRVDYVIIRMRVYSRFGNTAVWILCIAKIRKYFTLDTLYNQDSEIFHSGYFV